MGLGIDGKSVNRRGVTWTEEGHTSKVHQCHYCAYIATTRTNLLNHIRTHTGEKPFACPHCPFRATQKENLKAHIRVHTGEKPYACTLCSYRSAQKSNLKSHMWTHQKWGNFGFQCTVNFFVLFFFDCMWIIWRTVVWAHIKNCISLSNMYCLALIVSLSQYIYIFFYIFLMHEFRFSVYTCETIENCMCFY